MSLDSWIKSHPISSEELSLLFPTEELINSQNTENCKFNFLKLIGLENQNYTLDLNHQGATQIIKQLFEYYNDKDTLFVVSDLEHPAVKQIIDSIHCYIIKEFNDVFTANIETIQDICEKAKSYKRVFVYVIGMQNAFMKASPNEFYIKLKSSLNSNHIQNIICIDAVQELFLSKRDYSIFDYIIGTAHATISNFNLGFLIRKNNLPSFNEANLEKRLAVFLKQLGILLKRQDKLYSFRKVLSDYFKETCPFRYRELDTVDYAFSFELDCKITQAEYKLFEKVLSLKYDVAVAPFQSTVIVRFRAPSIILGVNFNNEKRQDSFLEESIQKTYQLCSLLLDRQ